MANESFSISELIPARPQQIYAVWMNSEEHSAITGDAASVDAVIGGEHSAFGGYARGTNVELLEGRRIVQTWRTSEFPADCPDSRLEVTLEETVGGTMLTILHTDIPTGQGNTYRQGWEKYYLEPLKRYFNDGNSDADVEEDEPTEVEIRRAAPEPAAAKPRARAARKAAKKPARKAAKRGVKKPARAAKVRAKGRTKPKAKAKAKPRAKAKKPARKAKAAPKRAAKKRRKSR